MKLLPSIYRRAAELVDSGRYDFACCAIGEACREKDLPHAEFDSEERRYFAGTFLRGNEFCLAGPPGTLAFGNSDDPACQQHRVMALLFCWAMLQNP